MSSKSRSRFVRGTCLLVIAACCAPAAMAQVPSITMTSPQAVAPGTTTDVTIRGANLAGATGMWTSFPAQVALAPDVKDNGTKAGQVVYRVTVPAEVTPGVHGIRVATPTGVSSLQLFVVDDLPSIAQNRANTTPAAAQKITLPTAVDGAVASLSRNYYRFQVEAGRQLSFEVLARRLGSPLDPMIRILDLDGRELTYSDDEAGLSADSRLSHTFEKAGEYLVEVRDIRYKGGATYTYRLRIGDFPCVNVPVPMGAKRGELVTVNFAGPDVGGVQPMQLQIPSDPTVDWINVAAKRQGGTSSGFAVMSVGGGNEFLETEPNDQRQQPNRVELGTSLNGLLQRPGDVDHFVFKGTKGQKFTLAAITRRQGAPTDLVLRLYNADGTQVAQAEDTGNHDGVINYTFPADGDYTLAVEDLHQRGGTGFAYRVDVRPTETGFTLDAESDVVNVPAGGAAMLTVNAVRKGYNGPIEVVAVDLPPGFTSMPTVIGAGRNSVVLTLTAAADATPGKLPLIHLVGRARIGNKDYETSATCNAAMKTAFAGMPWPPQILAGRLGLGVSPAAQISLSTDSREVVFGKGLTATIKVTATRAEGFNEAITLAVSPAKNGLPPNVSVAVKSIPKDKNEVDITVTATNKAALGEFTAVLVGTIKQGKVTVAQPLPGLRLKLQAPYQLTVDAGSGKLTKGGKLKVKVKVDRNPAFSGPVALTVQSLPTGVTAAAASIPADKSEIEVELTAAADAPAATVNNVTLTGAATVGSSKLSETSAAVALTVE